MTHKKNKTKKPMFLCLAAWLASARLACTGVIPRLCRDEGGGGRREGGQERSVREGGWGEEGGGAGEECEGGREWGVGGGMGGGGGGVRVEGLAVPIFFGRTVGGGS